MALKKVIKKSTTPVETENDILAYGKEYALISGQIKTLEARKKKLADLIKKGAEKFGVKNDKGSFYLEKGGLSMGKVCKKSYSINEELAIPYLKEYGLKSCIDTVEKVNGDRLNKAVSSGKIDLSTVESFTNEKVSYSVSVVEVETMPEVEQSELKMAARKK